MKKERFFIFFLLFAFCLVGAPLFGGGGDYPPLTLNEESSFNRSMDEALIAAEKRVMHLLESVAKGKVISPAIKLELEHAKTMLDVKQTLVNNFRGTSSIRSPLIRQKFLQLLKQDSVTLQDLSALQTLVAQERLKVE